MDGALSCLTWVLMSTLMTMARILITGSRSWTDEKAIRKAFKPLRDRYGKDVTLISGACPTGADWICERIACDYQWHVERHPAEWDKYAKRAGFIRNAAMVRTGADQALAFILDESPGSTMTAKLADQAGIPVVRCHATTGSSTLTWTITPTPTGGTS